MLILLMYSATVGFLSVQSLGQVSQVATLISAFSALGSIMIGCFSLWRHQTKLGMGESVSAEYLTPTLNAYFASTVIVHLHA